MDLKLVHTAEVFDGHTAIVNCVWLSPDGKEFDTGTDETMSSLHLSWQNIVDYKNVPFLFKTDLYDVYTEEQLDPAKVKFQKDLMLSTITHAVTESGTRALIEIDPEVKYYSDSHDRDFGSAFYKVYLTGSESDLLDVIGMLDQMDIAKEDSEITFMSPLDLHELHNFKGEDGKEIYGSLKLSWAVHESLQEGDSVKITPAGIKKIEEQWPWHIPMQFSNCIVVPSNNDYFINVSIPYVDSYKGNAIIKFPKDNADMWIVRSDVTSRLKLSAVDNAILQQLKDWAEDPAKVPTFDYGGNLYKWLIDANKAGDLRSLDRKSINTMFGQAKNIQQAQNPDAVRKSPEQLEREKKQAELDEKVTNFIARFKDSKSVPAQELLSFISDETSPLYKYIYSFAMNKDNTKIPLKDLNNLYHSLLSTIKMHHNNQYVQPQRHYEAFPYTSYTSDLKSTRHDVSGAGTQFGIAIIPNYGALSPRMADVFRYALEEGSAHLRDALAFSRITPITYSVLSLNEKKPITFKVWAISEMQADDYQKIGGHDTGLVRTMEDKFGKGIAEELRQYYRHWPENLMNVIIEKAVENNVDQVWMPKGDDVAIKTNKYQASGAPIDWNRYYDRPAKVFGGELKNVGTELTLDPGSSYDKKANMFYVIDLANKKLTGSLTLMWNGNTPSKVAYNSAGADDVEDKKKLFRSYGAEVEGDYVTLYHGTDSKFKSKELYYNSYLSASPAGKDATGNAAADTYGKQVHKYVLPISDVEATGAGEFLYKGNPPQPEPGAKYPDKLYKAYQDYYGASFTKGEMDAESPDYFKMVATMGLPGGKAEFDNLMLEHTKKLSWSTPKFTPDTPEVYWRTPGAKVGILFISRNKDRKEDSASPFMTTHFHVFALFPNMEFDPETLDTKALQERYRDTLASVTGEFEIGYSDTFTGALDIVNNFIFDKLKGDGILSLRNGETGNIFTVYGSGQFDKESSQKLSWRTYQVGDSVTITPAGKAYLTDKYYYVVGEKSIGEITEARIIAVRPGALLITIKYLPLSSIEPIKIKKIIVLMTTEEAEKYINRGIDTTSALYDLRPGDDVKVIGGDAIYLGLEGQIEAVNDSGTGVTEYVVVFPSVGNFAKPFTRYELMPISVGELKLSWQQLVPGEDVEPGDEFKYNGGADTQWETIRTLKVGDSVIINSQPTSGGYFIVHIKGSNDLAFPQVIDYADLMKYFTKVNETTSSKRSAIFSAFKTQFQIKDKVIFTDAGKAFLKTSPSVHYFTRGNVILDDEPLYVDEVYRSERTGECFITIDVHYLDPNQVFGPHRYFPLTLTEDEANKYLYQEVKPYYEPKRLAALADYNWTDIKEKLEMHFNYILSHNKEDARFADIIKYVNDSDIEQWAWRTFFDEYRIPNQWRGDPEFMAECERIVTEDMHVHLMGAPYIDWLHWIQKAWDDVRWFIKNQMEISPDMRVSKEELARDWWILWQREQFPEDMKTAPWWNTCKETIVAMMKDKGLGDITSTGYTPPEKSETTIDDLLNINTNKDEDNNEGGELVDPQGNPANPDLGEFDYNKVLKDLQLPAADAETVDDLLDQLHQAIQSNDTVKATEIKEKLRRMQSAVYTLHDKRIHKLSKMQEASLRLSWQSFRAGDRVKIVHPQQNNILYRNHQGTVTDKYLPKVAGKYVIQLDQKLFGGTIYTEAEAGELVHISPLPDKSSTLHKVDNISKLGWNVRKPGEVQIGDFVKVKDSFEPYDQTDENLRGLTGIVTGKTTGNQGAASWVLLEGESAGIFLYDDSLEVLPHKQSTLRKVDRLEKISWKSNNATEDKLDAGSAGYPFVFMLADNKLVIGNFGDAHEDLLNSDFPDEEAFNKEFAEHKVYYGRLSEHGGIIAFWEPEYLHTANVPKLMECLVDLMVSGRLQNNPKIIFGAEHNKTYTREELSQVTSSLKLSWDVSKFNIGDRVKIVDFDPPFSQFIGVTGTISSIQMKDNNPKLLEYKVKLDNAKGVYAHCLPNQMEHISNTTASLSLSWKNVEPDLASIAEDFKNNPQRKYVLTDPQAAQVFDEQIGSIWTVDGLEHIAAQDRLTLRLERSNERSEILRVKFILYENFIKWFKPVTESSLQTNSWNIPPVYEIGDEVYILFTVPPIRGTIADKESNPDVYYVESDDPRVVSEAKQEAEYEAKDDPDLDKENFIRHYTIAVSPENLRPVNDTESSLKLSWNTDRNYKRGDKVIVYISSMEGSIGIVTDNKGNGWYNVSVNGKSYLLYKTDFHLVITQNKTTSLKLSWNIPGVRPIQNGTLFIYKGGAGDTWEKQHYNITEGTIVRVTHQMLTMDAVWVRFMAEGKEVASLLSAVALYNYFKIYNAKGLQSSLEVNSWASLSVDDFVRIHDTKNTGFDNESGKVVEVKLDKAGAPVYNVSIDSINGFVWHFTREQLSKITSKSASLKLSWGPQSTYAPGTVVRVIHADPKWNGSTGTIRYMIKNNITNPDIRLYSIRIGQDYAQFYQRELEHVYSKDVEPDLFLDAALKLSWATPPFNIGDNVIFTEAGIQLLKDIFTYINIDVNKPPHGKIVDIFKMLKEYRISVAGFPGGHYVTVPITNAAKYITLEGPSTKSSLKLGWAQYSGFDKLKEFYEDHKGSYTDRGDYYGFEFNVKIYSHIPDWVIEKLGEEEAYAVYSDHIEMSYEDDADYLKGLFPWIEKIYRRGRSGGHLVVVPKNAAEIDAILSAPNDISDPEEQYDIPYAQEIAIAYPLLAQTVKDIITGMTATYEGDEGDEFWKEEIENNFPDEAEDTEVNESMPPTESSLKLSWGGTVTKDKLKVGDRLNLTLENGTPVSGDILDLGAHTFTVEVTATPTETMDKILKGRLFTIHYTDLIEHPERYHTASKLSWQTFNVGDKVIIKPESKSIFAYSTGIIVGKDGDSISVDLGKVEPFGDHWTREFHAEDLAHASDFDSKQQNASLLLSWSIQRFKIGDKVTFSELGCTEIAAMYKGKHTPITPEEFSTLIATVVNVNYKGAVRIKYPRNNDYMPFIYLDLPANLAADYLVKLPSITESSLTLSWLNDFKIGDIVLLKDLTSDRLLGYNNMTGKVIDINYRTGKYLVKVSNINLGSSFVTIECSNYNLSLVNTTESSLQLNSWKHNTEVIPMTTKEVLIMLQQELAAENRSTNNMDFDSTETYIGVEPLTDTQVQTIMQQHPGILPSEKYRNKWYTNYYIASRRYMGDTLFDFVGVNAINRTVEIIEPSFLNTQAEINNVLQNI